nr:GRF zinc finger protein [Tanacetum cinerariifolium]
MIAKHNKYLEEYFDSIDPKDACPLIKGLEELKWDRNMVQDYLDDDYISVNGTLYAIKTGCVGTISTDHMKGKDRFIRRPPTHCQCGKPLARRVAWTNINPCRRFLNYRNSTNPGMPHCNSFYWIDPELPNEWYKSQLPQLYLTLNQEQRVHFLGQLSAQERLEIIQDEFEVYQNKMETEIKAMDTTLLFNVLVLFNADTNFLLY